VLLGGQLPHLADTLAVVVQVVAMVQTFLLVVLAVVELTQLDQQVDRV
jgi:hypothetical protein